MTPARLSNVPTASECQLYVCWATIQHHVRRYNQGSLRLMLMPGHGHVLGVIGKESRKMGLDLFKEKGVPLENQEFTWRELVQAPTSKLDDDAFTRVRIILMNGLESEALRFSHATARMMNGAFRLPLAQVRRVEQHQQDRKSVV